MALAGALKLLPDEPGTLAVVIFPDNIFKYASSILRHYPELVPEQTEDENTTSGTPSVSERVLAQLYENLKNPHDTIRVKQLNESLQQPDSPLVIDIRSPDMFAEGHIAGSVNIPEADLPDRMDEIPADRDAPIVMVCNIGKFSKHATLYLKSKGYRSVRSAKGGLNEWVRKGFEMASETAEPSSAE